MENTDYTYWRGNHNGLLYRYSHKSKKLYFFAAKAQNSWVFSSYHGRVIPSKAWSHLSLDQAKKEFPMAFPNE